MCVCVCIGFKNRNQQSKLERESFDVERLSEAFVFIASETHDLALQRTGGKMGQMGIHQPDAFLIV